MKGQTMTLPKTVVAEDHRLEQVAENGTVNLARHRWHWTLDETNPDRVGIRDYARAVERAESTISTTVRGYARWTDRGAPISLADAIALANMGAERAAAAEAVADAMGGNVANVSRHHRDRVRETLASAREAAERRGTSVPDELPRIAQAHERQRQAAQSKRDDKAARGVLYARLELRLGTAQRALVDVLAQARVADLDDEMVELLAHTIDNLRALLSMIDMAVAGTTDVDWDAELSRLGAV